MQNAYQGTFSIHTAHMYGIFKPYYTYAEESSFSSSTISDSAVISISEETLFKYTQKLIKILNEYNFCIPKEEQIKAQKTIDNFDTEKLKEPDLVFSHIDLINLNFWTSKNVILGDFVHYLESIIHNTDYYTKGMGFTTKYDGNRDRSSICAISVPSLYLSFSIQDAPAFIPIDRLEKYYRNIKVVTTISDNKDDIFEKNLVLTDSIMEARAGTIGEGRDNEFTAYKVDTFVAKCGYLRDVVRQVKEIVKYKFLCIKALLYSSMIEQKSTNCLDILYASEKEALQADQLIWKAGSDAQIKAFLFETLTEFFSEIESDLYCVYDVQQHTLKKFVYVCLKSAGSIFQLDLSKTKFCSSNTVGAELFNTVSTIDNLVKQLCSIKKMLLSYSKNNKS